MIDSEVIFISGLFPKEIEDEINNNSKLSVQNAANNLQWEFVKGLVHHTNGNLIVLNSLYIGSFPKRYKKLKINKMHFNIENNSFQGINLGFLNIPILKNFFRYLTISRVLKKNIHDDKKYTIVAYAMTNVMTKILKKYKKYKNINTVLIVPDLPEYMNFSKKKNLFYKLLKKQYIKSLYRDIRKIDGFVFLTKYMAEKISVNYARYVIIEGIFSLDRDITTNPKNHDIFTCLYSGGLNESYGVKDLVDSFDKISISNIELILCGHGDLTDYVLQKTKQNNKIKYIGQISHLEVIKLQKNANLLINPRRNEHNFTKYSFPSKILEYMASGTPVLMYKLDGIPEEYYDKVLLIDNYKSIDEAIENIYFKDKLDLLRVADSARSFILNEKNNKAQTIKLLNLIISLNKKS